MNEKIVAWVAEQLLLRLGKKKEKISTADPSELLEALRQVIGSYLDKYSLQNKCDFVHNIDPELCAEQVWIYLRMNQEVTHASRND